MAKFEVILPTEFMDKISRLEKNLPKILDEAIEEGATKACDNVIRPSLENAVRNSSKRSTGELVNSLGVSPVKVRTDGFRNAKIGFNEPRLHQPKTKKPRSYKVQTNAMIANVLEYGRQGQTARPWLRNSKKKAQKVFEDTAIQVFDEKVGL